MLFIAGALFGMAALEPHSSYDVLWPSLAGLGVGLGLVVVASAEAIISNVPMEDSGLAGGLQATAVQFGGVLGASVLGSVVASRAASVLPAKLAAFGLGSHVAHRLLTDTALVSQGLPPGTHHRVGPGRGGGQVRRPRRVHVGLPSRTRHRWRGGAGRGGGRALHPGWQLDVSAPVHV